MDKDCAAVNIYDSLKHCKGDTKLPGLRPRAVGIPKSQIVSYAKLPDVSDKASMDTISTLEGDYVLAADSKFLFIDILSTASNVKSESQGEAPSKTFLNSVTLMHPSTGKAATGFSRLVLNDDFLWIVQQRDGQWRVIGNEMVETDTKPTQDSGMAVTDASGTTFEASVTDVCPAPFYEGKLLTEKGVYDCKTNTYEVAGE